MIPTSIWDLTPGMTQRLQELYAAPEHYSASGIAEVLSREFHLRITRNSVIGKTHRLRMPVRIKPVVAGPRIRQHSPRPRSPRPKARGVLPTTCRSRAVASTSDRATTT